MNNKYKSQVLRPSFPSSNHTYLSVEQVLEDGRAIRKSAMLVDDVAKRCEGMSPNDFLLENLLANNVELSETKLNSFGFVSHDLCVDYISSKIQNT